MRSARLVTTGLAFVLVATSCSDSTEPTPDSADPGTTSTTGVSRQSDGRLRIGFLLPRPGDSPLGEGVGAAAELAVQLVNDAGGVLGRDVTVHQRIEGLTLNDTQQAFDELIDVDVDVVIGPTSSLTTIAELGTMVDSGVLTCSPTASALLLDDFPDNGLFFRTIPSDSLQALALAEQAERTGTRQVSVVYFDDAYGRGLANAVTDELEEKAIPVEVTRVGAGDDDVRSEAASALANESEVVIVLGDTTSGPRILAAMGSVLRRNTDLETPDVLVNDGLRGVNPDLMSELPADLRTAVQGVGPTATRTFGSEPRGLFATNAYDCATVIALAALQADSDDPLAIAEQITSVTNDGSVCRRFSDCAPLLEAGLNIDYDGPGGSLDLGEDGDPRQARFDLFTFDGRGIDTKEATLVVRRE